MSLVRGALVVVRGAGDLATGCIVRLVRSGFRVVALETARPTAIRRTVSLSEAVFEGSVTVEGVRAFRCDAVPGAWARLEVPVLVDPECRVLDTVAPTALLDGIVAKRNLGTRIDMAPVVVALGPGFVAGRDVHAVVETMRGHGPGRVVHSPVAGIAVPSRAIGEAVEAGSPLLAVGEMVVASPISGVVRGMIRPGLEVPAGLKVADVDPRGVRESCFTVSDKARAVAGGALEAILSLGL
ncbi:MAG: molybdenum hydroxylase [Thermoanaerobaculia bacterium]|nr:molybdenum hydroxylase [Thermoanaerobaculia bacterium]